MNIFQHAISKLCAIHKTASMTKATLLHIFLWFFIGAFLLNIIVYYVYKTGLVHSTRQKDGTLKKRQTLRGVISMICMLFLIIIFIVSFDYKTFYHISNINYIDLTITNFILITLLILYDSFFIDLYVLGIWRPKILNIPKELTIESMKYHVKKQFTIGWLIVIPIVIFSSLIYFFISN